ncbi:MAG TPA: MBL fold metallo-hydrolase [Burkholderiaceae bacterium]|nr:MBL fold metallo-hydrolase [Burkholderiaceae bacterium]
MLLVATVHARETLVAAAPAPKAPPDASAVSGVDPNTVFVAPDYERPAPRDEDGFRNSDGTRIAPPLTSVGKFYWDMLTTTRTPTNLRPLVPDLGFLRANRSETSVTWIGHSTVLMQLAGINVLSDPQFSERASPFSWIGPKRRTLPAMSMDELPPIDVVVISHDHYDHLDKASVLGLAARFDPLFIVPLGMDVVLRDWGVTKVKALDWWQHERVQSVAGREIEVHAVPLHHWSSRTIFKRNATLWAGYVIRSVDFSFFFAGDTGYSNDFERIGQKFGPIDMALIPVGAYEPRWFMKPQHVNPEEAVRIHRDVRAKRSIGIHWGTFELTTEPIDAPRSEIPKALAAAGVPLDEFMLFELGEIGVWRAEQKVPDTRGQSPYNPKRQWRRGEPR